MKIYTSYFYQIRFFPPNLIPLSTAMSDPKWYHNPEEVYYDNRNVLIGLRAEPFVPNERLSGYSGTEFLNLYKCQLKMLNFNEIIERFKKLEKQIGKPCDFALIFHESPDNPYSERETVQNWFAENGIKITEWKGESENDKNKNSAR